MRLRRVREWRVNFPEDHILARIGGGGVTSEENARRTFASWRRVALTYRRVWRLDCKWKVADIRDWDDKRGTWKPREHWRCRRDY